jgi:hypothetical protein
MELVILLILALVAGYFIASSRYRKSIDGVGDTTRKWWDNSRAWVSGRLGRGSGNEFVTWVNGPGNDQMPEDFVTWLNGLSEQGANDFTVKLEKYMQGLGYNLSALVGGSLDAQPSIMQVFVETIVVYSNEYKKAKEVHENPTDEEAALAEEEPVQKPARKKASRRKAQPAASSAGDA